MTDKPLTFKDVEDFIIKLNYEPLITTIKGDWCVDEGEYWWVDGDKQAYNGEAMEGSTTTGGMHLINIDTQQGYWMTYVFKTENKLTYDEFCDKYKGCM